MKKILINSIHENEIRVAIIHGNKLCNLDIASFDRQSIMSNIYKGRITRIESSLEAVFIDYGLKRNGFLPFKEIHKEYFPLKFLNTCNYKIHHPLIEGQEFIVQVIKNERGTKGALLTTFISLVGSYLVLLPYNFNVKGISKKIKGHNRILLKKMISMLNIPNNMGVIIRTAGENQSIEILQKDLEFCINDWNKIQKSLIRYSAPCLIYKKKIF
ncbi:MAG: ribonuclease E/G [Buchnera aphidicola (Chaetogeoica yunlongensis)]